MKKLLILLFSILLLSSPSVFADDISDFSIEGISIGDSLLDYMTEDEILEEIEITKDDYSYIEEPNKYGEVYLQKNYQTYDSLSFFVKNTPTSPYITNKNEKYIILSVRGLIEFDEDFDSCILKRDEVVGDLSKIFPNVQQREAFGKHGIDPSGKSIFDSVYFEFDSEETIRLTCADLEETLRIKNNWNDSLSVSIFSKEIVVWLRN